MSNRKTYKLGEIAQIIGGGTPSTKVDEFWNGDIGWLTPRDLTGYSNKFISQGERNLTQEGLKNSSARLMPKGTVLMTSRAPIGYLAIADNEVCTNQGFKSFVVDEKVVGNEFLYYLLKNNVERIKSLGTGSTFAEVSASVLKGIEFDIPDVPTQKEIAQILTSLDDKIELNLQMNQTLEAMAQSIYKEWFVKFNFPGFDGELVDGLPKGWRIEKLSNVCTVKYGKDHKHLDNGTIPVYGSGGIMRYADKALYESESILIPRKGTLTNLFYVVQPFWSVDTMFYTIINENNIRKYLFYLLKSLNLASMNVGSAVPSLTTEVLNKIDIVIPEMELLKEFENIVSSYYSKMNENIKQIEALTKTRDTLLPKLISGQLEIV